MQNKIYLFLISLSLFLFACNSKKTIEADSGRAEIKQEKGYAFNFVRSDSLSTVLDLAAAEDKLVFVDLYTTWCLPCKIMDEEVFSHKETGAFFNEHFISYKVDAEQKNGPDLRVIFKAHGFPTLLFLDSRGRVLEKKVGSAFHTEMMQLARSAINKSNGI